jgi:rubredoxin
VESSSQAAPEEHQAASSSFSAAAEEFSCPVCLEIQYQSTTLVPCGHSLCRGCISAGSGKSTTCPVCRATSRQQVPNRCIDNAITALSHCPRFFNPDDLAVYLERSGTGAGPASSARSNQPSSGAAGPSGGGKRRRLLRQELQGLGATSENAICVD